MLAPLSWIKDFVDVDCMPEELEKKLFDCGFEVEQIIPYGDKIDKAGRCEPKGRLVQCRRRRNDNKAAAHKPL